ncbi:hypothetical protein Ciccas_003809 [Cichlidogyrus casuarinus]|uniref:Uncharacterized protein n=1 Tax=Cichlidogyrus casuarinus TaxID=1844966 RepID=A0ABD2QDR2_9PLAT
MGKEEGANMRIVLQTDPAELVKLLFGMFLQYGFVIKSNQIKLLPAQSSCAHQAVGLPDHLLR